jgi:hypothetical protein
LTIAAVQKLLQSGQRDLIASNFRAIASGAKFGPIKAYVCPERIWNRARIGRHITIESIILAFIKFMNASPLVKTASGRTVLLVNAVAQPPMGHHRYRHDKGQKVTTATSS